MIQGGIIKLTGLCITNAPHTSTCSYHSKVTKHTPQAKLFFVFTHHLSTAAQILEWLFQGN
jgi:hypothetical protein